MNLVAAIARRTAELIDAVRHRLNEQPERNTTVDYTMPPHIHIDMDPDPPIAELAPYDGPPLPDDDTWGMYL